MSVDGIDTKEIRAAETALAPTATAQTKTKETFEAVVPHTHAVAITVVEKLRISKAKASHEPEEGATEGAQRGSARHLVATLVSGLD